MTSLSTDEDNDKPYECEWCNWETEQLVLWDNRFEPWRSKWLCEVCHGPLGRQAHYPRLDTSSVELMQALAWQTNYLLSRQGQTL